MSWAGGVLADPWFRAGVMRAVTRKGLERSMDPAKSSRGGRRCAAGQSAVCFATQTPAAWAAGRP